MTAADMVILEMLDIVTKFFERAGCPLSDAQLIAVDDARERVTA